MSRSIRKWVAAVGATGFFLGVLACNNDPSSSDAPRPVEDVVSSTSAVSSTDTTDTKVKSSIGMAFQRIRAGSFRMGSPGDEKGRWGDERPHKVTLSREYLLGAYEVTQGQWKAVMDNDPGYFKTCGADCPVENVSWYEAVDFCNRLSRKEGLPPCYVGSGEEIRWDRDCTGYRLPTEAEWEYAARAGSTTAYFMGNCLSTDEANYDGRFPLEGCPKGVYRETTRKVGSFPPNAWGLHEMHGNVSEWVWDWKADYDYEDATDPTGPSTGTCRVDRGGTWDRNARDARSARRPCMAPHERGRHLGFRVCRSIR